MLAECSLGGSYPEPDVSIRSFLQKILYTVFTHLKDPTSIKCCKSSDQYVNISVTNDKLVPSPLARIQSKMAKKFAKQIVAPIAIAIRKIFLLI